MPDLSPTLEAVVLRALAKEPDKRFPSVQDFATAFRHASEGTEVDLASISASEARSGAADSNTAPPPVDSGQRDPLNLFLATKLHMPRPRAFSHLPGCRPADD